MKRLIVGFIILAYVFPVIGQNVNWRGENRDGSYNEESLLKMWPEDGPELLFSVSGIGKGWSSAIKAEDVIYINGKKDSLEYLSAISEKGELLWQVPYSRAWNKSYPEVRGSVTIDGNRVFIISGTGQLVCIDKKTGKRLWNVNADYEFDAIVSPFGTAETPLVIDNKVICTPAGNRTTAVAYDKISGNLIWHSEPVGGEKAFMTPVEYRYKGFRYILVGTTTHIAALIPETGEIAWKYKHHDPTRDRGNPGDGICLVNSPIYWKDEIFICKGYNYPSMMIKMDSTGKFVTEKWINQTLDNEYGGVVRIGDYIYGSNFNNPAKGKWVCLEWHSGEVTYVHDWINKGSIISADGLLYLYEERKGNIALVKPNPDSFELISTFKNYKGKGLHWAHLSIFDGNMFVRRGDVLLAYDIKKRN